MSFVHLLSKTASNNKSCKYIQSSFKQITFNVLMDLPVKCSWFIKENMTYVLVESNLVGKFGNLCQHGFVLLLHPLKIHFRDLCFLLKICYVPKYVHLSPHFDLKQFNNLKKVLSVQHVMDKLGRLSYTTVTVILLCRI